MTSRAPQFNSLIQVVECTSFRSGETYDTLLTRLGSFLERIDAQKLFVAGKFECTTWIPHAGPIQFNIRIWQDGGEHVIEFQRRRGSSVVFINEIWQIYRGAEQHTRPTPPVSHDPNTLQTVIEMIGSEYEDNQYQALLALSSDTETTENAKLVLCSDDAMRIIMRMIRADDDSEHHIRTVAIRIFANVVIANAENEKIIPLLHQVTPRIVDNLALEPTTVDVMELHRQSQRALDAMNMVSSPISTV